MLDNEDCKNVTHQVEHNFAKKHILQRAQRVRIILRAQILERLKEVGVSRRVVFVFRVEDAGLQVELGLEVWWAVNGVCSGTRGCQGCLQLH